MARMIRFKFVPEVRLEEASDKLEALRHCTLALIRKCLCFAPRTPKDYYRPCVLSKKPFTVYVELCILTYEQI